MLKSLVALIKLTYLNNDFDLYCFLKFGQFLKKTQIV